MKIYKKSRVCLKRNSRGMYPMTVAGVIILLLSALEYSRALAGSEAVILFSVATDSPAACDQGLTRTGVTATLQRRLLLSDSTEPVPWQTLDVVHIAALENKSCQQQNFSFTFNSSSIGGGGGVSQFRLLQWEHGGGSCNCWGIVPNSWRVKLGEAEYQQLPDPQYCATTGYQFTREPCNLTLFCSGSASVPRGFLSPPLRLGAAGSMNATAAAGNDASARGRGNATWELCPVEGRGNVIETEKKLLNCTGAANTIQVQFWLSFSLGGNCDGPESVEKGVEFSILGSDGNWVPLSYCHYDYTRRTAIRIGNFTDSLNFVGIRGYQVPAHQINTSRLVTVEICDPAYLQQSHAQFRWLETSEHPINQSSPVDVWGLDNVQIVTVHSNGSQSVLVNDSFDSQSQLNLSDWKADVRNGDLSDLSPCGSNETGKMLLFYDTKWTDERGGATSRIVSRLVITKPLSLGDIVVVKQPQTTPPLSTTMTTPPSLTGATPTAPDTTTSEEDQEEAELQMRLMNTEKDILENIARDDVLNAILQLAEPEAATDLLANLTANGTLTDPLVAVYLLGTIIKNFTQLLTSPPPVSGTPLPPMPTSSGSGTLEYEEVVDEFTEQLLDIGSNIIAMETRLKEEGGESRDNVDIIGSTLLRIMDTIAFIVFSLDEGAATGSHINLMARRESGPPPPPPPRNGSTDSSSGPPVAFSHRNNYNIRIPREQLGRFPNMSENGDGETRVVSFLFSNITGLFPGQLPTSQSSSSLASDILSASLECQNEACPTGDADDSLNDTVTITIVHSDTVQGSIRDNTSDSNVSCVFWNFQSNQGVLSIGEWSEEGCWRNETLSNSSVTVCECNHLTHFAILLSASPLPISPGNIIALQTIGYVGVTISLVAMAMTIFAFVALKALHTMRNYIHINLCVNLGIAQLIFVAGVDKVGEGEESVPAHCRAVAVLLHYFFLVSFMWMLMEGVVLYVVLVKVFVKRKKLYMLAFTVASYGAPLLYLGLLTLPLGFALPRAMPSYGYQEACFLYHGTYFVWAFIAPVLLIFLSNFGFFIMAASIMWRHQKKQSDTKKLQQIRRWLRSAVSLVVIMGLTWIVGVVIVEVEELLPLAYIYTFMAAFQGLFIFIIFVPFSKQVREAYSKWWRVKVSESDILSKYFGEKIVGSSSVSKSKLVDRTFPRVGNYTLPNSSPPMDNLTLSAKMVPLTPTSVAAPVGAGPSSASLDSLMCPTDMPSLDEVAVTLQEQAGTDSQPDSQLPGVRSHNHWGTLRKNVKEGMFFKVVYSSNYFKSDGKEGVSPPSGHGDEDDVVITNSHT